MPGTDKPEMKTGWWWCSYKSPDPNARTWSLVFLRKHKSMGWIISDAQLGLSMVNTNIHHYDSWVWVGNGPNGN